MMGMRGGGQGIGGMISRRLYVMIEHEADSVRMVYVGEDIVLICSGEGNLVVFIDDIMIL